MWLPGEEGLRMGEYVAGEYVGGHEADWITSLYAEMHWGNCGGYTGKHRAGVVAGSDAA